MSALTLPLDAVSSVKNYVLHLQKELCSAFVALDGQGAFIEDAWQRPQGGGGISAVFTKGAVFEKAAVNVSHVYGEKLPPSAILSRPELQDAAFEALGLSLIMHPDNPYVPTAHANVRFFVAHVPKGPPLWWFGGGFDLTPYYGFEEDCRHFHAMAEQACLPFGKDLYPECKAWADRYFYLPHRAEARGIGGLFFDEYNRGSFNDSFAFLQSVGDHFIKAYGPIVEKRKTHAFGPREKDFQRYRRGRYVEFNLIYDRGTLFGLQSQGRTESILLSLPPEATWTYAWTPEAKSAEEKLYCDFLPIRDWLDVLKPR